MPEAPGAAGVEIFYLRQDKRENVIVYRERVKYTDEIKPLLTQPPQRFLSLGYSLEISGSVRDATHAWVHLAPEESSLLREGYYQVATDKVKAVHDFAESRNSEYSSFDDFR